MSAEDVEAMIKENEADMPGLRADYLDPKPASIRKAKLKAKAIPPAPRSHRKRRGLPGAF